MSAFKEVLNLPVIVLIALLTAYGWVMTEDYNAEYVSNEPERIYGPCRSDAPSPAGLLRSPATRHADAIATAGAASRFSY